MKVALVQLRAETRRLASNGEQLLLTLGIPVLLLVFFSLVDVLPTGTKDPIDFLAPGILALATMSTAMVSLGIGTGFERSYHVLKRLGATPLGRPRLIGAKIGSVIAVRDRAVRGPDPDRIRARLESAVHRTGLLAIAGVVVGTMAFAGIGLTLAGRLPGEINLAAQNGLYLVLLLLGGMVIPFAKLPARSAQRRQGAAVRRARPTCCATRSATPAHSPARRGSCSASGRS